MSSFGQWYEEKKAEESGESQHSSWFDGTDQMLPLFNTDSMQNLSWGSMKASMEAQMPKKIMGMGYQQRFQVRNRGSRSVAFSGVSCNNVFDSHRLLQALLSHRHPLFTGMNRFSVAFCFFRRFSLPWPSLSAYPCSLCIHTNSLSPLPWVRSHLWLRLAF